MRRSDPAVTLISCPVCGLWIQLSGPAGAPASCQTTYGCTGKLLMVSAAKKIEPTPTPIGA